MQKYIELADQLPKLNNKKRKNAEREMQNIKESHPKYFDNDKRRYDEYKEITNKLSGSKYSYNETTNYVINKCKIIFDSRDEEFQYPSLEDFKTIISKKFKILKTRELEKTNRVLFHLNKK